jgi:membrane protease YdiL (CAAX protease family)
VAAVRPAPADRPRARWGLLDALAAVAFAFLGSIVVSALLGAPKHPTLTQQFLLNVPLWLALAIVPVWATRVKGDGPVVDLGLRFHPVDLAIGLAAGTLLQLVLVPLVYAPLHSVYSRHDIEKASRDLVDKAHGAGWLLLVVMTVVLAPVIEELFYRGLVMRAMERDLRERKVRGASAIAVVVTGVVFAAMHFQVASLLGLAVFGIVVGALVMWTGRLGTSICTHMVFNAWALWQVRR